MTETVLRTRRFHHLSAQQRAYIRTEIDKAIKPYMGLRGLTESTKITMSIRLGRKFGVPRFVIIDVYEYLTTKRHERGL